MAKQDEKTHPKVKKLQDRLYQARSWHAYVDLIQRLCMRYYLGQHWRNSRPAASAGIVLPPKNAIDIVDNMIAPTIRHLSARLKLYDLRASFEPTRQDDAEVWLTAKQMKAWYNRWLPDSRLPQCLGRQNNLRNIIGSAFSTYYFDDDAPGGVRIEMVGPNRLTLDPSVTSQELDDHEFVIDSEALSVEAAQRMLSAYVSANNEIFKTDATVAMLRQSESWFGKSLFQLQPGATSSETPGIVVHRMFDKRFKEVAFIVQNVMPTRKKEDPQARFEPDWKMVYDGAWQYGNPYLHRSCLDNPVMSYGTSFVAEMIAPQNIANLVKKHELRTFFSRSTLKYFAEQESLVNPEQLDSPQENAVIYVKRGAGNFNERVPQLMQLPKSDPSPEFLAQRAEEALMRVASMSNNMLGEAADRQPFRSVELMIQQGSAPLRDISETDRHRDNQFINGLVRAGVDRMARLRPKKFVSYVGPGLSSPSLARVASRTILNGETIASIRPASYNPETPEAVQVRLWAAVVAGHLSYEQFNEEMFELTGRELEAGQEIAYQQAFEIARMALKGEDVVIRPLDNHEIIMRVLKKLAEARVTEEYTDAQCEALERLFLECRRVMFAVKQMDAAEQGLLGAVGAAGEEPPAQGTPPMQEGAPPQAGVALSQPAG